MHDPGVPVELPGFGNNTEIPCCLEKRVAVGPRCVLVQPPGAPRAPGAERLDASHETTTRSGEIRISQTRVCAKVCLLSKAVVLETKNATLRAAGGRAVDEVHVSEHKLCVFGGSSGMSACVFPEVLPARTLSNRRRANICPMSTIYKSLGFSIVMPAASKRLIMEERIKVPETCRQVACRAPGKSPPAILPARSEAVQRLSKKWFRKPGLGPSRLAELGGLFVNLGRTLTESWPKAAKHGRRLPGLSKLGSRPIPVGRDLEDRTARQSHSRKPEVSPASEPCAPNLGNVLVYRHSGLPTTTPRPASCMLRCSFRRPPKRRAEDVCAVLC